MTAATERRDAGGWSRRFVGRLDPGERVGELLFGLIMVLTFALGAGIELSGDPGASRDLLLAALGCNTACGIIVGALHLMARLSERGRLHRLLIAMRVSNAILIGLLVYVGHRWASVTGASGWRTGLFMAVLGVALVLVAIALGG